MAGFYLFIDCDLSKHTHKKKRLLFRIKYGASKISFIKKKKNQILELNSQLHLLMLGLFSFY